MAETLEYWKEMQLYTPEATLESLSGIHGRDAKLELIVSNAEIVQQRTSRETNYVLSVDAREACTNLPLQGSFPLISEVRHREGNYRTLASGSLAATIMLLGRIGKHPGKSGIFGGKVSFNIVHPTQLYLELGYAEFPKGSGREFLLDRETAYYV